MCSSWPRGVLWRDAEFLKLWAAQAVSQLGTQVTLLALPLAAILVLDATATEVALLGAVEVLPFLLLTLPAGVWVDRLPRRPILVVADLGRAVALASIPLAYALDALTLPTPVRRRLRSRGSVRLLRRLVPRVPPVARRPESAR